MRVLNRSQITEVSHDSKMAKLVRSDINWTTEPRYGKNPFEMFGPAYSPLTDHRDFTDVDPSRTHRIREIRNSPHLAYYGSEFSIIPCCTLIISQKFSHRSHDHRVRCVNMLSSIVDSELRSTQVITRSETRRSSILWMWKRRRGSESQQGSGSMCRRLPWS